MKYSSSDHFIIDVLGFRKFTNKIYAYKSSKHLLHKSAYLTGTEIKTLGFMLINVNKY